MGICGCEVGAAGDFSVSVATVDSLSTLGGHTSESSEGAL
jgi:hypothetical protein